jgi:hypothetical protein
MKASAVIITILSILLIASVAISFKYLKTFRVENYKIEEANKQYILKDQRLQCMTRTLITAPYGLSKWEAHYYSVIFDDFSINYKIPWEIYPAIIRVESNFKGTLVSSKKAKGFMQVLEPTGKSAADEIGINFVAGETLWNDFDNIIIGCYYLSANIKKQGFDEGIKSYLGGPAHLKTAAADKDASQYMAQYKTTVAKEYKFLNCMFRGLSAEMGFKYEEIHISSYSDSISVDVEPFSYLKKSK